MQAPYPQLLHARSGEAPHRTVDPTPESERPSKRITIEPLEAEDATTAGVERVVEALEAQGGCIVWIRNTVREAQEAWQKLKDMGIEADLLHARFARYDRNEKEEGLLDRFGSPERLKKKQKERPDKRVVIATQVIEQSVDVDFDLMLSDLAPVDLLLQRAGRLWRHERESRGHHTEPVLVVLMPPIEGRASLRFGNSAYVYDADILARSAVLVNESPEWILPDSCRTLVGELYDRNETYWNAERMECDANRLAEVRARLTEKKQAMISRAGKARMSPPGGVPVMREARNDGENETAVGLSTRLGGQTASVALFRETPTGPVPIGAYTPLPAPPEDEFAARLGVQEAVSMATVSFPWYGPLPDSQPPEALANIASWWKRQFPYDGRAFVLLSDDGAFAQGDLSGRYTPEEGLVLDRTRSAAPSGSAPFEDL